MDNYQMIATGGMILGGAVTIIKAWVGLNSRQQEHARLIADVTARLETMQHQCIAQHKGIDKDKMLFGNMIAKLETLLDERTEKRVA